MVDTFLRTISIIDLQAIALSFHIVAYGPEAVGRLTGKQGRGLQIAVDAGSHEIIGAKIADLEDGIGHSIRQGNKLTGIIGWRNRRLIIVRCKDTYFLDKRTKETKKLMFLCTYV